MAFETSQRSPRCARDDEILQSLPSLRVGTTKQSNDRPAVPVMTESYGNQYIPNS